MKMLSSRITLKHFLTAVASTPVTEASQATNNVVLCSSISSPELNGGAGAKAEPQVEPAPEPLDSPNATQTVHAASETSSDTGVSQVFYYFKDFFMR